MDINELRRIPIAKAADNGALLFIVICVLTGTVGCATVDPVPESAKDSSISVFDTSCESLGLTRNCSSREPELKLLIAGEELRVAADDTGMKLMFINSGFWATFSDVFTSNPIFFNSPKVSHRTNRIFVLVQVELEKQGIRVLSATPVMHTSDIFGYIMYLSGDGYSVLKALIRQKSSG